MNLVVENLRLFRLTMSVLFVVSLSASTLVASAADTELTSPVRVLSAWSLPDAGGSVVNFSPGDKAAYRVVLFWATWCPYCKALMPHLEAFRAKHEAMASREKNSTQTSLPMEFLALNVWEDGDPEAYALESGFNFRLVPHAEKVAKEYGVKGTPGLFLVNNQNEVLYERRSGTTPEQVIIDLEFVISNQRVSLEQN